MFYFLGLRLSPLGPFALGRTFLSDTLYAMSGPLPYLLNLELNVPSSDSYAYLLQSYTGPSHSCL